MYEVVLSLDGLARAAIVALAMVFTLNSIAEAQAVLGLIAVSAVCAVSLQPLIAKLARAIGFAPALVTVHVGGLVAFGGLAGVVAWDLDTQAKSVETSLHTAIDDLEPGSWPAALAGDIEAHRRVASFFGSIATRSVAGDDAATAVLHRTGQAILVAVLSAFLVAGREQMLDALTSITASKSRRRAIRETLGGSALKAGGYLRRTIVVSSAPRAGRCRCHRGVRFAHRHFARVRGGAAVDGADARAGGGMGSDVRARDNALWPPRARDCRHRRTCDGRRLDRARKVCRARRAASVRCSARSAWREAWRREASPAPRWDCSLPPAPPASRRLRRPSPRRPGDSSSSAPRTRNRCPSWPACRLIRPNGARLSLRISWRSAIAVATLVVAGGRATPAAVEDGFDPHLDRRRPDHRARDRPPGFVRATSRSRPARHGDRHRGRARLGREHGPVPDDRATGIAQFQRARRRCTGGRGIVAESAAHRARARERQRGDTSRGNDPRAARARRRFATRSSG